MKKLSLSVLFAIMMIALFATAASAEGPLTPASVDPVNVNANKTADGIDDETGATAASVKKNLTGQATHGSYQNNTNSCASCHQTHTSKGDQLLFADGIYQTCSACHDGTLGYANVFASGETAKTTGAGTFGGSHGASQHMATGSVNINAAPGGNPVADDGVQGTQWGESFNCASCHAPHGSYSERLLHYNPNGIASMPADQGGNQVEIPVVDTLPAFATGAATVLLRTEDATTGEVVIAQYVKGDTAYVQTHKPWLYGYDSRTTATSYWTNLRKADNSAISGLDKNVYFSYEHAEVKSLNATGATTLKAATKGFISSPIIVKMEENTTTHSVVQSAYWNGSTTTALGMTADELKQLGYSVDGTGKVTGLGKAMSKFCSACHTDYLASSTNGTPSQSHFETGVDAYRHSTTSDSYTCVRCHYGHGTDAYIMKDALGRTIADLTNETVMGTGNAMTPEAALGYIQDNNASSALKKFTNMSVCWACHNSSHAITLKNTERAEDHPTGMPGTN